MTLNAGLDIMANTLDRIRQSGAGAVEQLSQLSKVPLGVQIDGSSGPGDGTPFNAKGAGAAIPGSRGWNYLQSGGGVDTGSIYTGGGQGGGARGGSGSRSGDWGGVNIPGDSSRGGGGGAGGRNDGPGGVGRGPQWTNLGAPATSTVVLPPAQSQALGATATNTASMAADLSTLVRLLSAGGVDLPRDIV